MTDTHKLKPCPFCGGAGRLKIATHGGNIYAQVTCETYGCPANNGTSPPQSAVAAVRAWNTRIAP